MSGPEAPEGGNGPNRGAAFSWRDGEAPGDAWTESAAGGPVTSPDWRPASRPGGERRAVKRAAWVHAGAEGKSPGARHRRCDTLHARRGRHSEEDGFIQILKT
jgi:hypothetical protein